MRKNQAKKRKNEFPSFSYLKFFALTISFAIALTFTVRTYQSIKESRFTAPNHTILLITDRPNIININLNKKNILIFEVQDPKIIKNLTTRQAISFHLGIPIDSIIKMKNSKEILDLSSEIQSLSFALSFFTSPDSFNLTNINKIDMLKIFLIANLEAQKIGKASQASVLGESTSTFKNESILNRNRTVEIVNASHFDGLANQMSKMFNNIGYTVISTKTSTSSKKAKIIYRIEKDDTVEKIISLLEMPSSYESKIAIADISIIIDDAYAQKYLQLMD